MYVLAVLAGCTYCLHAYFDWMQTPLTLWGPLYNNRGNVSSNENCKARWPECLEMCTIFFQRGLKLILLPYKAVDFAIATINILIIDVNFTHTYIYTYIYIKKK